MAERGIIDGRRTIRWKEGRKSVARAGARRSGPGFSRRPGFVARASMYVGRLARRPAPLAPRRQSPSVTTRNQSPAAGRDLNLRNLDEMKKQCSREWKRNFSFLSPSPLSFLHDSRESHQGNRFISFECVKKKREGAGNSSS